MKRAAIYCRISQDRSGEGAGVGRQEKDCRALAERLGFSVAQVYVDDDRSAYSGRPRPAYAEMMRGVEGQSFDAVLCWHPDRLHRSPRELEAYIDATEHAGIVTHTATAGDLDLATPSGRAVARTVGAWARFESEHKAERVSRAMRELAESGRFTGGIVPFGWSIVADRSPVLVEDEAALIREATRRFLAGESIGSLARWANTTDLRTRTGKQWKHITLRQVLRRAKNAGLATVDGEVVGPSTFPAIVSEDEWRAVVTTMDRPERRTAQSARIKYLLSGIAVCGTCGGLMGAATVARAERRVPIYRCRDTTDATRSPRAGTTHPQRTIEPIDAFVSSVIVARLQRDDVSELFAVDRRADVQALEVERAGIRTALDDLAAQFGDGNITASQLGLASKRLQDRLEGVSGRLVEAASGSALAGFVSSGMEATDWWEGATLEQRRAVVDLLCTVTVDAVGRGRARVFHPDTVHITWKGVSDAE